MSNNEELKAFDETFKRILEDLSSTGNKHVSELQQTLEWVKETFIQNVPNGKRTRGLALVSTYKILANQSEQELTDDNLELARILGWCIEILHAFFLILDDIMDQSVTRRGQLCWFRQNNVGLMAINDANLMNEEIYHLLKIYFRDKSYYVKLVEIFHEMTRYTAYGQCMDLMSCLPNGRPQLELFTKSRYETIVKFKTSFYSFALPVRLGMSRKHDLKHLCAFKSSGIHLFQYKLETVIHVFSYKKKLIAIDFFSCSTAMLLTNFDDSRDHNFAEKVSFKMGYLFQMQDDFMDCFGDSTITGKIGTDIEEGKCNWNIVTALQLANDKQSIKLLKYYGLKNSEAVKKVKKVYNDLELVQVYHKTEEFCYQELCELIKNSENECKINPKTFYDLLNKIYRRNK